MGCREKNRKIEVNIFFHMMIQWMEWGIFFHHPGRGHSGSHFPAQMVFVGVFHISRRGGS